MSAPDPLARLAEALKNMILTASVARAAAHAMAVRYGVAPIEERMDDLAHGIEEASAALALAREAKGERFNRLGFHLYTNHERERIESIPTKGGREWTKVLVLPLPPEAREKEEKRGARDRVPIPGGARTMSERSAAEFTFTLEPFHLPNFLRVRGIEGTVSVGALTDEQAKAYWEAMRDKWLMHVAKRRPK
jgi:hypothetical protein